MKTSCEDFIHSQTKFLTGTVQDFIIRANAIVELNKKDANQTKVWNVLCFTAYHKNLGIIRIYLGPQGTQIRLA